MELKKELQSLIETIEKEEVDKGEMAKDLGYVDVKSIYEGVSRGKSKPMLTLLKLYLKYVQTQKSLALLKASAKLPMEHIRTTVGDVEERILGLDAIVTELQVSLRELRAGLGISSKTAELKSAGNAPAAKTKNNRNKGTR